MKTFNVNSDQLIVRFTCPKCGNLIEEDVSDIIPVPNWGEEHASDSENSDSMEIECPECGMQFTIEVYKNIYEGNVQIAYCDKDGQEQEIDDDDIELEESESPDYEESDEE